MGISPLQVDPSRTATLRRQFSAEVVRRYNRVLAKLRQLIVEEDAFGLRLSLPSQTFNASYSSTQVNITDAEVVSKIKYVQRSIDPADVVEIETEPHVTVRYGLHTQEVGEVRRVVEQFGLIRLEIGRLSLFQNPDADVLKFEISSKSLDELNDRLRLLEHTQTFKDYEPHLTVAYLKPGTGQKYLNWTGVEGTELTFQSFVFSDRDRNQSTVTVNAGRWRFLTSPEKLKAFQDWLALQLKDEITTDERTTSDDWWRKYVERGYEKGAGRAFDDVRKPALQQKDGDVSDFYRGSKAEFLRSSFGRAETIEKTQLLASRVFTDLKGVTEAVSTQLSRTLVDGLTQGMNPRAIAREMQKAIDGIGKVRSLTIARTEIIRAHAEGQLDAMERLGVTRVGVMVEWATARDSRVCPLCIPLQGMVLKISEARGMLPRHPNCRCAWSPANVGEERTKQQRTKDRIQQAIRKSLKAETPKASETEAKRRTSWVGADTKVSKERPKSVLEK